MLREPGYSGRAGRPRSTRPKGSATRTASASMATRLSRPVPTRSKAPSRSQRHTLATAHGTQRQHARRRRWRAGGARVVGWAGAAHIRPRRRGGRVDLLIPQAPRCHPERLPQALPNRRLADQLEARHRACVLLDLLQARRDDFIRNVVDLLLVVRPRKPPAPRKGDAT